MVFPLPVLLFGDLGLETSSPNAEQHRNSRAHFHALVTLSFQGFKVKA